MTARSIIALPGLMISTASATSAGAATVRSARVCTSRFPSRNSIRRQSAGRLERFLTGFLASQ
ncbi:MAG TPA: hypothetical protein VJT72_05060 [Pseudonocardiaceae bacterium]|nr:hypothetical protein [Pseudonocardiaceae bacterium]